MAKVEWVDPEVAEQYANKLETVDWYEHEVNVPSLLNLMPTLRVDVLDFGCGPGNFTALLAQNYDVEGCDIAPRMVEIAQERYPDIKFHNWDGLKEFPTDSQYDVIFSKLAIHFLDDFDSFIDQLDKILRESGKLVFSVPHPLRTLVKTAGQYFDQAEYETEIGSYGLRVTMIHRTIQDYIQPFTERGYVLTGLNEPRISDRQAEEHDVDVEDLLTPKRLNLRFKKT